MRKFANLGESARTGLYYYYKSRKVFRGKELSSPRAQEQNIVSNKQRVSPERFRHQE